MSYVLPIQEYIDGEYLYIPRRSENRKRWGELKNTRHSLRMRNETILEGYRSGISVEQLATEFSLSPKTVYKILSEMKNNE